MQINSVNSLTFGTRIVPSPYLNKAIDLAKTDIKYGTEQGRKNAENFYNSLIKIENDNAKTELKIDDSNKKLPPVLSLDGTKFFIETYRDVENKTGQAVQDAVNLMAESKYFNLNTANYAKNKNLLTAFDKWVY